MTLPIFAPGSTMIAEDRWHGLLWSAVPARVVASTEDLLVNFVPTGTLATVATNRGLPETVGLTRDQRKMLALRTRKAYVGQRAEAPDKLHIYRPGRWARVNLGWDAGTGEFLGWYVNFELPPTATPQGILSKDLVLDIWVDPDRTWRWKDDEDFQTALDDHILDPSVEGPVRAEAERVIDEINAGVGPFADQWTAYRPDPAWAVPTLPEAYGPGGRLWSLPPAP